MSRDAQSEEPQTAPAGRARWLAGGLWSRSRKHEWSRRRYERQSRNLGRIAVGSAAGAAAGGGLTVWLAEPWLGLISVVTGAAAAGVKAYEDHLGPREAKDAHARARRAFEVLHGRYKNFYELQAPTLSDADALATLMELEAQREELRSTMIDEEDGAQEV